MSRARTQGVARAQYEDRGRDARGFRSSSYCARAAATRWAMGDGRWAIARRTRPRSMDESDRSMDESAREGGRKARARRRGAIARDGTRRRRAREASRQTRSRVLGAEDNPFHAVRISRPSPAAVASRVARVVVVVVVVHRRRPREAVHGSRRAISRTFHLSSAW